MWSHEQLGKKLLEAYESFNPANIPNHRLPGSVESPCIDSPLSLVATLIVVTPAYAQEPDAKQIAQERRQAENDAPHLVEVLGLKPGMTVADIGTGGGAMAVVLGKWIGSASVYATDITERALRTTREYAEKEGLTNVTVIEGGADRTNLPAACCDALFLRHVYHHITAVEAFNKSLLASLKPGGRLAIIDFRPGRREARCPRRSGESRRPRHTAAGRD